MKRLIIAALALVLTASQAFAAGACVPSRFHLAQDSNFSQIVFKLACTADPSDGTVAVTSLNAAALSTGLPKPYWQFGYNIVEVWTETPASGNPDAADVAITDEAGFPLFSQVGLVSGSVSTRTVGAMSFFPQVSRYLKVAHPNQSTASATWNTYVKLQK